LCFQRKIPRKGYSDQMIESILLELSSLDSNNFEDCAHVGEREGRVYSSKLIVLVDEALGYVTCS